MDKEQKEELKGILNQKEYWTTEEIQLIKDEFGVEYKKSRLYELLKELRMNHSPTF